MISYMMMSMQKTFSGFTYSENKTKIDFLDHCGCKIHKTIQITCITLHPYTTISPPCFQIMGDGCKGGRIRVNVALNVDCSTNHMV